MSALAYAVVTLFAADLPITFRDGVSPDRGYAGTRDVRITLSGDNPVLRPDANYDALATDLADGFTGTVSTVMRFDLTPLQGGGPVAAATLQLNLTNATAEAFDAYRLVKAWDVSRVTWLETGLGVAWEQPGASGPLDRAPLPLFTAGGAAGTQPFAFTDAGVAALQGWLVDPPSNFGFVLENHDAVDSIRFDSCDAPTVTAHPELRITWTDGGLATLRNGLATYMGCTDAPIGTGHDAGANANAMGLAVGGASVTAQSVSFIRFDLAGATPPAAQLVGASLVLHVANVDLDPVDVVEVLRPWSEAATWTTSDGASPWNLPGASGPTDRSTTPLASFTPADAGEVQVALPLTLVRAWIANAGLNLGVALVPTANSRVSLFRDREAVAAAERPALVLTFAVDAGVDGGTDAGVSTDDGGTPGPRSLSAGCGCQSSGPGLALIAALALVRSRRRAARQRADLTAPQHVARSARPDAGAFPFHA